LRVYTTGASGDKDDDLGKRARFRRAADRDINVLRLSHFRAAPRITPFYLPPFVDARCRAARCACARCLALPRQTAWGVRYRVALVSQQQS